ncbi:MAG: murein L,D-transpeptidase [Myxococcales bacterium]|nr:murein L,D-transpeptidase [Myxococcales bacterium]
MTEPLNPFLSSRMSAVAADCIVDREDAYFLGQAMDPASAIDRRMISDLLRRCADKMEPEGFTALRKRLSGKSFQVADRVLLEEGARGPEVTRLRETLGRMSRGVMRDSRIDPGPGDRFDAATRTALLQLQTSLGLPVDGRLTSRTLVAMNRLLMAKGLPVLDVERFAAAPKNIRLHFYPGAEAESLVVMQGERVLDVYPMRGGPDKTRPDPRAHNVTRMPYAPTPPGSYRLAGSAAHTTAAWKLSQIPWGAPLREKDREIQFQQAPGKEWKFATGEKSVFRGQPKELQFSRQDFLDTRGVVQERWEHNDFGHRAFFLSKEGKRQGHMIHATPREEARYGEEQLPLTESHGCEHMYPEDLDEAAAKGYFRPGTPFIVHGYQEPLPPSAEILRRD